MFGQHTPLQLTDLPVGVLVILACSSIGVYGIVLSGWASGSTYPLLGGLRSAAQMISYEVAMGLSIVAVFISRARCRRRRSWRPGRRQRADLPRLEFIADLVRCAAAVSFVIYAISVVGETNRAPFDLPEAESELVGGFHTEYSSMKFALFFLAEYINMVTVSALATTLFLGGWRAPWPISLGRREQRLVAAALVHRSRSSSLLFVFVWLRGTLPRLRYDQFMHFGWKVLIPINLVWILSVATMRTVAREVDLVHWRGRALRRRADACSCWWPAAGRPVGALTMAEPGGEVRTDGRAEYCPDRAAPPADRRPEPADGGFPMPPMDLVVPPSPGCAARSRRRGAPSRVGPAVATVTGGRRCLTHQTGATGRASTARRSAGRAAARPLRQGLRRDLRARCSARSTPSSTRSSPKPTAPRYHGRHVLNRHPDGLEKCVGCELCAWACPADAIYVEGGDNTEEAALLPG